MKESLKFMGACAVALTLVFDVFGAWKGLGRRSRRDSGETPISTVAKNPATFAPSIDRGAALAVVVGVDREELWGLADTFLDGLIAASGADGGPFRGLKAILSEYKKDPFRDLKSDDEAVAFLRESGVLDANFRWAVLSMDGLPDKNGESPIPEGLSLVVAGDIDIEKFMRVAQRRLAESEEDAANFTEMTLEGEKIWRLVPQNEKSAKGMKDANIDPYIAWLDRQVVIIALSRDVMARQLRLYRRGEGKAGALRVDDFFDTDAYFFVSGVGNAMREFASSKDLAEWEFIPNGKEAFLGLKTVEAKLKAGAGGSISLSLRMRAASRNDADVLRTVVGLYLVGVRSSLGEDDEAKGKNLAKILGSVRVSGSDDIIELSLNTSVPALATALYPFIAEAMADGESESDKERDESASTFVSDGEPPKEILNLMASSYAEEGRTERSREMYLEVLAKDAANHDALMGLWRLSLQEGALEEAKSYLKRAIHAPTQKGDERFDVALLHMMNNDLEKARTALQGIIDSKASVRALALLAGVVLTQADRETDSQRKRRLLAEVENAILPKMEALSGSPRDFFVKITHALTLMRKDTDDETLRKARAALEVAWECRPMAAVGGMALDLDVRLQDRESAERHALKILRLNPSHAFANWVMGSICMDEGKPLEAERYLRESAGGAHPYAPAQNDLAEILRRQGNLAEAEKFARAAVKTAPNLYVAWETLASTLLDRGKNLDEAKRCVQKAIELSEGEDPRIQLTLARVQIAKKEFAEARKTLRALDKRREDLTSDRDKATLDELKERARGR